MAPVSCGKCGRKLTGLPIRSRVLACDEGLMGSLRVTHQEIDCAACGQRTTLHLRERTVLKIKFWVQARCGCRGTEGTLVPPSPDRILQEG